MHRSVVLLCVMLFTPCASAQESTVVLLHGIGRGPASLKLLSERLVQYGYRTSVIGYNPFDLTPDSALQIVTRQIDSVRRTTYGTIHFVGHSFGGLLVRGYLQQNRFGALGRVVLLGTPNRGTPIVDFLRGSWVLRLAGPSAQQLGTDTSAFPASIGLPEYETGIIAGSIRPFDNDGYLPGEDDGIVPVESAKLPGMKDYLQLPISHFTMLRDSYIAMQIDMFLRTGAFRHSELYPSE